MPARVRAAHVAVLPGVGLGVPAAPVATGVGAETTGSRQGLGSVVSAAVAHEAATTAAIPSDKPRSAGHTHRRGRVMAQG